MPAPGQVDQGTERSARLHALMERAVALYDGKRYREALALCDEVARLDPSAALPEIMRGECRRALLKRRARLAAVVAAVLVMAIGAVVVYRQLARIRRKPSEGTIHLAERDEQRFAFRSGLGAHKGIEFTWALLQTDGRPAPSAEQRWLKPEHNAPWACTYTPGASAVRASGGKPTATRRVVAIGADPAGGQVVRAEWILRVADVPTPPKILAVEPAPEHRTAIVPGGARTFRVEAVDGDGGTELTFEWLAAGRAKAAGSGPAWTYRRPGKPQQLGPRPGPTDDKQIVVCRLSNRFGKPFTQTLTWIVERVPSNVPPEIVAVEPDFRHTIRFEDDRPVRLEASAHDPDRDDELLFRWQLDGVIIAVTPTCTLRPPNDPPAANKVHRLRLTVADICGAADERTWTLVNAE